MDFLEIERIISEYTGKIFLFFGHYFDNIVKNNDKRVHYGIYTSMISGNCYKMPNFGVKDKSYTLIPIQFIKRISVNINDLLGLKEFVLDGYYKTYFVNKFNIYIENTLQVAWILNLIKSIQFNISDDIIVEMNKLIFKLIKSYLEEKVECGDFIGFCQSTLRDIQLKLFVYNSDDIKRIGYAV